METAEPLTLANHHFILYALICSGTTDATSVQCPNVKDQCVGIGVTSSLVEWTLTPGSDLSSSGLTIMCVDLINDTHVSPVGGVYNVGPHQVLCTSTSDTFPDCLISFTVSGKVRFKRRVPLEMDVQFTNNGNLFRNNKKIR